MKAFLILLLMQFVACSNSTEEGTDIVMSQNLEKDLAVLQQRRIYFGHQSVGSNILDGMRDLLTGERKGALTILNVKQSTSLPATFFAESAIGENRNVQGKCDAFREKITSMNGVVDIALMKLCFVDITHQTDADSMFGIYSRSIDSLKKDFPSVRFVHVTCPLTIRTAGWKRMIKSLLGREDIYELGNMQRSRFNDLLIERYASDPIYDLAAVESTAPDGSRITYDLDGRRCYALHPGYTSDGGHLNAAGRKRAALALIQTLASVK